MEIKRAKVDCEHIYRKMDLVTVCESCLINLEEENETLMKEVEKLK